MVFIQMPAEVDLQSITFGNEIQYNKFARAYPVKSKENMYIHVETPILHCPFGANAYIQDGKEKYSLTFHWEADNAASDIVDFHRFLSDLELAVKEAADRAGTDWRLPDNRETGFHPLLHYTEGNVSVRAKIQTFNDKVDLAVFDEKDNEIEVTAETLKNIVRPGSTARGIVRVMPVWASGNKWGITLKLCSLQVKEPENQFRQNLFS